MTKREKDKISQKARTDFRRKESLCISCGNPGLVPDRTQCLRCANRAKFYNDRNKAAIKLATFNAYGGPICKCCGENLLMLLTIDHINENGAAHRREIFGNPDSRKGRGTGGNMYVWLRARGYPEGYQVLCFNCNVGKHLNKGICPHQTHSASA